MDRRSLIFVAAALIAALTIFASGVAAQTAPAGRARGSAKNWTPPKTQDGQPDLQGVWLDSFATPLERPKALEGRATLTDAEVQNLKQRADQIFKSDADSDYAAGDAVYMAALGNTTVYKNAGATSGHDIMIDREFDNRTSVVVDPPDGRIPPMTAAGRERLARLNERAAHPARASDVSNPNRCITGGVPRLGGRYGAGDYGYYEIVQSPGYVLVFTEVIREIRIIPLDDRPHLPKSMGTWEGDSRGHWESNTLVVDTTNFAPQATFMGAAESLHITERFTRIAPDEIRYEVKVDDPTTWTKPWTAVVRLKHRDDVLYEDACHEDNLPMVGILTGERAQEKAAEEKGTAPKPAQ